MNNNLYVPSLYLRSVIDRPGGHMKTLWFDADTNQEEMILAGDVGGTNTNLAIVGRTGTKFSLIMECVFPSREIKDCIPVIQKTLQEANDRIPGLVINRCCISGAGPVEKNYIKLTNVEWDIDGDRICQTTGIPTVVINDFSAISYGIPLMDIEDPTQITKVPHVDGTFPAPTGNLRAVAGAGTGLGVGYLMTQGSRYQAFASEGGHIDFAPFDDDTFRVFEYLTEKLGMIPDAELFVSGQGITNIYKYFRDSGRFEHDNNYLTIIDAAEDSNKPALIAQYAKESSVCRDIMSVFIRAYGKFAGNACVMFIPEAGFYLAGGIVTKNEALFLDDNLFMKSFEMSYKMAKLLKRIPVFIIKDYSISLYGAANAAVSLLE